ncbi:hypothetical protein Tco_0623916 [Tanacetum coccineum]|uniref:Reverse transcriptase domain-containing protein n=1 Tax=Tanacetum coccineum TaxID=301880 RepID=A0ABQ4WCH9_9ASTR
MHTRSQTRNLHNQQHQAPPPVVEPFNLEEPLKTTLLPTTMVVNDTWLQLLEPPPRVTIEPIVSLKSTLTLSLKHALFKPRFKTSNSVGHDKDDPPCPHRYFTKITSTMKFPERPGTSDFRNCIQLDTFYNALNSNDQDSLNSAAGGNFLDKMPRDCLRIIESKSKVRNSRNKPVVAKVSASTSTPGTSDVCVTCGGAHSYQTCPATSGNVYRDNIQEYVSQAAAANYNQGNTGYRAQISNQIRPPGFPPVQNNHMQNQGNNQNRYNQNRGNFNQAPAYQPPVHQGQVYRPQVVQPPAYQAPAYQAPAPQIQGVSKEDFHSYVKANDAVMRNMQTQGQNMQNQLNNLATSNQRLESMLGLGSFMFVIFDLEPFVIFFRLRFSLSNNLPRSLISKELSLISEFEHEHVVDSKNLLDRVSSQRIHKDNAIGLWLTACEFNDVQQVVSQSEFSRAFFPYTHSSPSYLRTVFLLWSVFGRSLRFWVMRSNHDKRFRIALNSNSCRDVAVLSAGGTTFGTSFELDGSLLGKLLNPRYAGPSRWLKGWSVAYINAVLPQVLKRVHITFHVSNLKKCYSDDPLVVPLEGLQVDDKLHFVEEPVEIMDREVKQLRRSRVPIVKVRSVSRRASWFTWEREDQFRKKYPHLFTKTAPSSSAV